MILGPLLLELGAHPMAAAATSGLLVLGSSGSAVLKRSRGGSAVENGSDDDRCSAAKADTSSEDGHPSKTFSRASSRSGSTGPA